MIMRFARGKAKFGHVFQTPGEQVFKLPCKAACGRVTILDTKAKGGRIHGGICTWQGICAAYGRGGRSGLSTGALLHPARPDLYGRQLARPMFQGRRADGPARAGGLEKIRHRNLDRRRDGLFPLLREHRREAGAAHKRAARGGNGLREHDSEHPPVRGHLLEAGRAAL